VLSWSATDEGVTVQTDGETYHGRRLAICAGAWSKHLLAEVDVQLSVIAKQQNWYQIDRVEQKLVNDFPIVFVEEDDGEQFYCLPELDSLGMKVCRHTGGHPIEKADLLDCDVDKDELLLNEAFMDRSFHHSRHRLVHHSTCMYTMSRDGHFVVDNYPNHSNVAFAAGLSGHGFKFTPVLGHRLIEMLEGNHDSNLDFLSLKRFS
jgi:glycine/D-amino acid oxidase-like deaminating enzyme